MINVESWMPTAGELGGILLEADGKAKIGARFACEAEDDDRLYDYLERSGLDIAETGQAEALATRSVELSVEAVKRFATEMVELSRTSGYRLQAIEAPLALDQNIVLVSEPNYIPWWQA